jgi:hypothetical protein
MSTLGVVHMRGFRLVVWLMAGLLLIQPEVLARVQKQDDCRKTLQRASQLYGEARPEEAIKLLKECLNRPDGSEPWRKDAYVLLAKCYLQTDMLERVKEAEKAVEALLRIDCAYQPAPEPESLFRLVETVRKRVCGGEITVTAPVEDDSWEVGGTQVVRWAWTNLSGDVMIEFSSDGGKSFLILVQKARNTGSAEIKVPAEAAADCMVKVTSVESPAVSGTSSRFTVVETSWWSSYKWYVIGGAIVAGGVAVVLLAGKKVEELPLPPNPPSR